MAEIVGNIGGAYTDLHNKSPHPQNEHSCVTQFPC